MVRILPLEENRPRTWVDNEFIRMYMPLAPEGCVKLYLYALMLAEQGEQEADLAGALGMDEAQMREACLYWQEKGLMRLMPGSTAALVLVPPPWYGAKAARQGAAPAQSPFFAELQSCFGSRVLSMAELMRARDWVDIYGLSEAAALMLVRECISRSGKGTATPFAYIEAAAQSWAEQGVQDAEAAEAHIAARRVQQGGAQAVLKRMGKHRPPTQDESALYEGWLAAGFGPEAILAACESLAAYANPSFYNLDTLLKGHAQAGRKSVYAIEEALRLEEADRAFAQTLLERMGLRRNLQRQDTELVQVARRAWRMDDALLLLAAESACGKAHPFAHTRRLLERWHGEGIATTGAARAALDAEAAAKQDKAKKGKAFTYMQRASTVDAEAFIINLDDED